MELFELSAAEAAQLMTEGEISAEDLVRSCLARIAERDETVKAWAWIDPDMAVRKARELDKIRLSRGAIGPLHGLPFGIKDMINTADMPTQCNSPAHFGDQPTKDAHSVSIIKANGALILGKTDTLEFASGGRKALTRNPFNPAHTPGGSSSGSGAAVGDRQVPLALGTQTGGSHIRPAAFNGIYGIKPTHASVSWTGAHQYSVNLDTIGWYGRSARDLILVAEAYRLRGITTDYSIVPEKLKVGIARTHNWDKAAPEGKEALERAAKQLKDAGISVRDIDLPAPFAGLNEAQHLIMTAEGRVHFLAEYLEHFEDLHQDFRDKVENKEEITAEQLLEALNLAARCRESFDGLFGDDLDFIVTPSAPGEAPVGLHTTGDWVMNAMWTLLHVPCVAIPGHFGPKGLPVGVQIVGARFSDARLLAIAEAISPILDEHQKPPR